MALEKDDTINYKLMRWVFTLLLIIVVGFPFYWILITSVKSEAGIYNVPPTFWPQEFHLSRFLTIWKTIPLHIYMFNSIVVTLSTVLLALFLTSTAAYSLSRFNFKGVNLVIGLMLFTQLLPRSLLVIPYYFLLYSVGLLNTRFSLILSYSTFAIPISVLILRSYFKTAFPQSLEEAALIDGCTRFGAFWRIALPLSKPGLIAVGTFVSIGAWKEFMFASILITDSSKKVLSLGLTDLAGYGGTIDNVGQFMTAAIFACIPIILAFLYFQKHMISGLTAGSVKS